MMQELRLRLLRKNDKHESGHEIVGYQKQAEFTGHGIEIFQARADDDALWKTIWLFGTIEHDAFELGIKRDDEWIYDGDRVTGINCDGIVKQDSTGGLYIAWTDGGISGLNLIFSTKRIGTIHDEVTTP